MSSPRTPEHTPNGGAVTALILEVFRLNGRLLAAGDRLTRGLDLSSARWQVLGAVALAGAPQPVAHIARDMGLARQSVHRVVAELEQEGFVRLEPNPRHQRASLVTLTAKGGRAYAAASARQVPWANELARGSALRDLEAAVKVLRGIGASLGTGSGP